MEFSGKRKKRLPTVPIIPMIDTMFFLLVFFILTSLNVIKLEGINVNLPTSAPTTQQVKHIDLTVTINAKRQVYVDGKIQPRGKDIGPVLLNELGNKLHRAPTDDDLTRQSVIINADGMTPHRMVVNAIDQARGVQINKFSIATTSANQ
jgi:biopolymer transport protein ExbD